MTLVIVVVVVVGFGALVALLTRRQHRDEVSSVMHYEKAMQKLGQMLSDEHQGARSQSVHDQSPPARRAQPTTRSFLGPPHASPEVAGHDIHPEPSWLDKELRPRAVPNADISEPTRSLSQSHQPYSENKPLERSEREGVEPRLKFGFPPGYEERVDEAGNDRSDEEKKAIRHPLVFESEDLQAEESGEVGYGAMDERRPTKDVDGHFGDAFRGSPISPRNSVISRSLGWLGLGSMSEDISRTTRRGRHTKRTNARNLSAPSRDGDSLVRAGQSNADNLPSLADHDSFDESRVLGAGSYGGSYPSVENSTSPARPLSGYQTKYRGNSSSGWSIRWLRVSIVATVVVLIAAAATVVALSGHHSSPSATPIPRSSSSTKPVTKGKASSASKGLKGTSSTSRTNTKGASSSSSTTTPFVTTVGSATPTFATYRIATTAPYTLSFTATSRCWIGIYSDSAMTSLLWQGVLTAGQSHTFDAAGPVWLDLGAAFGVRVKANGVRITLPAHHLSPFRMAVEPS